MAIDAYRARRTVTTSSSYTKLFVAAAARASTYSTKRQCTERHNEQRRAERARNVSTKESETPASIT